MGNSGFSFLEAAFFCLLGALLIFRAIPPNRWFGLRTPRTLKDPSAWYLAHRAFGWVFLVIGALIALFSLWPTTQVHPATGLVCVLLVAAAFLFVYRRYAA
jgi:uncharacterized membrane protein